MRITITGPRSVGKTTTAIMLADKLGYAYVSGDEIMDKEMQLYGGLARVLRDNRKDLTDPRIIPCATKALQQDNAVFDQAGGALIAKDYGEQLGALLAKKSVIIGLLPSANDQQAIDVLYARERQRPHFYYLSDEDLRRKTADHYRDVKHAVQRLTKNIIYTAVLPPEKVVERCLSFLK